MIAWVRIVAIGVNSGRLGRYRSKINRAWLLRVKYDTEVSILGTRRWGNRKRWFGEKAIEFIFGHVGLVLLVGYEVLCSRYIMYESELLEKSVL